MMHLANLLIYGGVAGLVALIVSPWWGGFVFCVAAVATGVQFALGGKRQ